MVDERYLYKEILRAIKKKAGERLQVLGAKEEISFYPDGLMKNLDPDIRRYEQSIRDILRKMNQDGILIKSGSPVQYSITEKFEKNMINL